MLPLDPFAAPAAEPRQLQRLWAFLKRPLAFRQAQAAPESAPFESMAAALRQALRRACRSKASASRWRRLIIFEAWLRRHGPAALETIPLGQLYRVDQQLQGLAAGEPALQGLVTLIESVLARRMARVDEVQAPLSAMEFSSQVDISEIDADEALREFGWLEPELTAHGASAGTPQRQRTTTEDDHPITLPPLP